MYLRSFIHLITYIDEEKQKENTEKSSASVLVVIDSNRVSGIEMGRSPLIIRRSNNRSKIYVMERKREKNYLNRRRKFVGFDDHFGSIFLINCAE